ncbi:hypothetical protein [Actinomadura latina]|uniref:hypothetical protein n=1 Tax=Actinomadura latina TaxID=163603 RepID=UPI000A44CF00|nr:hypothetical protein [Actinomadura latina]
MSPIWCAVAVAERGWLLSAPQDGESPSVKVPDPPPDAPPGLDQKMETLLAWGKWGVLICGVAGLFICAGQMAIGRKNRSTFAADGATGIPWVLGGLSLAATAAPIVGVFFR